MNEILHDITLRNFRSYSEASYEFEEGVNIIVGPNASGKTNLLEAVHCICFGKGIKGTDSGMIRHGEEWLRLESRVDYSTRSFALQKDRLSSRSIKKIVINDSVLKRMSFSSIIPVVVFQPDDIRLSSGSPKRRRDYIDKLLSQIHPTFRSDLLAYERVLKQRNSALKNIDSKPEMFAWNLQLSNIGGKIVNERKKIIAEINEKIEQTYSSVAGKLFSISVEYQSAIKHHNYSEKMLSLLEKSLAIDSQRGTTSFGPHRDDLIIKINGQLMKDVGSRGENRTLVLALKIIEMEMLGGVHGRRPILLLDDVFSELDGLRRKMLTKYLKHGQSILTTTDADVVSQQTKTDSNFIAL